MPYKIDTDHVRLPRHLDRRVKLTTHDIQRIKTLYREGVGVREITRRMQKVSRRMIQFTIWPERLVQAKKLRDGSKYYNRKKHTIAMRLTRRYRVKVLQAKQ